jgi:hypothetical protein
VYAWKGFGFEAIAESNAYRDISSIERGESNKRIVAWIISGKQKTREKFFLRDNKLVMIRRGGL